MQTSAIQHFRVQESLSLRNWWEQQDLTEAELDKLLTLGAIFRNGSRLDLEDLKDLKLDAEDILRVHFNPRRYLWRPELVNSWVVHETEETLLVKKPAGLPTHPTLDNTRENLLMHLKLTSHPEALMVHRLDVGTEGLILFAKSVESQKNISKQFEERSIVKVYSALTKHWPFPPPMLEHWMQNADRAPRVLFNEPQAGRKLCRLYVTEHTNFEHQGEVFTESEIRLDTGRTHQIRVQLAKTGHSILGDHMYGSRYHWLPTYEDSQRLGTEAWALRCKMLQWEESDSIQHFEIEPWNHDDLTERTLSSTLSQ